jgi:hypothetical protein
MNIRLRQMLHMSPKERVPMNKCLSAVLVACLALAGAGAFAQLAVKPKPIINPPPTTKDWSDLAKLPDWSGTWNPKITDQDAQVKTNMPPWTPPAAELGPVNTTEALR